MLKKLSIWLMSFLLVFSFMPISQSTIYADETDLGSEVELWNAIVPLKTTVSFVNVGAHPDDERSDLLAYLSRGLGVNASSLIANRGEGGQNQIGSELSTPLGIIRSLEMQEAAKINGVDAHHLSKELDDDIFDFGFSKSPEETLEKWGEDVTKERLVRYIRETRPDIIMPTFRDVPDQHGHHRAMSQLAVEVFDMAANESLYSEQFGEGLDVWQAKKLYLPAESEESADFSVEIGDVDDIYGMSYPQLGEKSRYLHKSQGMGNDIPVEPTQAHIEKVSEKNLVETNNENEILNGIPADFGEWADQVPEEANILKEDLQALDQQIKETIDSYPESEAVFTESAQALKMTKDTLDQLETADIDDHLRADLEHKLTVKEKQLNETNYVASELEVKPESTDHILIQGQETETQVNIEQHGNQTMENVSLELKAPEDWQVSEGETFNSIENGDTESVSYNVVVPTDADYFHPYRDPVLRVALAYEVDDVEVERLVDFDETIAVLPEMSLELATEEMVVNSEEVQEEEQVEVKVTNYVDGPASTTVSLDIPEGWDYGPETQEIEFSEKHEEKTIEFTIELPEEVEEGTFDIQAKADYQGKELTDTIREIDYDHIENSYYQYPAQIKGNVFELNRVEDLKIGYIDSGFDEVDDYLRNAGFDITTLEEGMLADADLNQFDTIVTGIRAYMAREDLVEQNDALLDYVENGGHLVVQHNLPAEFDDADPAPYPLKVGRPSIEWRVTDENSEVNILNEASELLNFPNKINESDWENWVQERGLYFPMEWSDEYSTLVSMADPDEEPFDGSVLYAEYGEGSYLYTSLGFYRQIQNQVAGGYRIFTNFISYGHEQSDSDEHDEIVKLEDIDDIEVAFGTDFEELPLPKEVTGELADKTQVKIPVSWEDNESIYKSKETGEYSFTGNLDLPEEFVLSEGLEAKIKVNVLKKDTEENDDKEGEANSNNNNDGDVGATNNNSTENNGENSVVENNDQEKGKGSSLPKTATNIYTWLLVGLVILIIGAIAVFVSKRKK